MAASGHFSCPPPGSFVAVSGQFLVSAVNPGQERQAQLKAGGTAGAGSGRCQRRLEMNPLAAGRVLANVETRTDGRRPASKAEDGTPCGVVGRALTRPSSREGCRRSARFWCRPGNGSGGALGTNDHAARASQGNGVGRASTPSRDGGLSASGSDTGATSGRATPSNPLRLSADLSCPVPQILGEGVSTSREFFRLLE